MGTAERTAAICGVVLALLAACDATTAHDRLAALGIADTPAAFVASAGAGQTGVLELFLDAGMDVDATDERGVAAIVAAVAAERVEVVRLLIARGASLDAPAGNDGMTVLMLAARAGALEVVRALLEGGAPVDSQDGFGNTALMQAAAAGHREVAAHLLAHFADPDRRTTESGASALGLAAARGDADMVALLLAEGADPQTREERLGMTPLGVAAFKGHLETVRALLAAGADPGAADRDGRTPHALAVAFGHDAVAAALAEARPRHVHTGSGLFRRAATFAPPAGWVLADPFTDQTPFFLGSASLRHSGGPAGTRRALLRAPNEIGAQAFLIRGPAAEWMPLLRAELEELERHPLVEQQPVADLVTADGARLVVSVSRMHEGLVSGDDMTWLLAALRLGDEVLIVDAGGPTETFPLETIVAAVASLDLGRDLGIETATRAVKASRSGG